MTIAVLSTGTPMLNLRKRQLLQHLAARVERLRAQQQTGLLVGPKLVSEPVGVFRIEFDDLAVDSRDAVGRRAASGSYTDSTCSPLTASSAGNESLFWRFSTTHRCRSGTNVYISSLWRSILRGLPSRLSSCSNSPSLRVGVMRDPRRLNEIAPLIDERTLVILLLGGLVDPVEQVRGGAAGDERIVGLRKDTRCGGQQYGCTEQKCRQPPPDSRFIQPQCLHQTIGLAWSLRQARISGIEPGMTGCCANC